jgi:Protein of unknown function (DUF2971)
MGSLLCSWKDTPQAGFRRKLFEMPPERLFKYSKADTARVILSNQTLQWSSPVAFNDPFDLKNYFHIDFLWSDLREEVLKKLQEIIYSPQEPSFSDANEVASTIKGWRQSFGSLSPQYTRFFLSEALSGTFAKCELLAEEERNHWLEEKEIVRILCFAERPDKLLMWSHYAEQHAGVVLEFDTKLFEQSASSHAIKVEYSDVVPTPFTYQQFLDWLLGQKVFPDVSDYTVAVASSKSTHWGYEQEWRLLRYEDPPKSGRHSYFAYPPDALVGAYFGSRIDSAEHDALVTLIKRKYPHAQIFNMREKSGRYELEIEPA